MADAAGMGHNTAMAEDTHWRIDRHIPLALIMAVILQTFVVAWWAAGVNNRLSNLEVLTGALTNMNTRMTSLEDRIGFMNEKLADIKHGVDRAFPLHAPPQKR